VTNDGWIIIETIMVGHRHDAGFKGPVAIPRPAVEDAW
jgi:hypothetical protein